MTGPTTVRRVGGIADRQRLDGGDQRVGERGRRRRRTITRPVAVHFWPA